MEKDSLIKSTVSSSEKAAGKPEAKNPAPRDIIFRQFDIGQPKTPVTVGPDEQYLRNFSAPPAIEGVTDDEAGRIKKLLLKNFDSSDDSSKFSSAEPPTPYENSIRTDTKAAADEPKKYEPAPAPPDTDYSPPTVPSGPDPVERTMIFAGLCLVLLTALIIAASFSNRNRYYLKPAGGAIEIRQGDFAPMGNRLIYSLPGMQPPEKIKSVYTENEILPLVSAYYIEKADALLDVPGMPDFEGIRSYLNEALSSLGITENQRNVVSTRLRNIDLMTLVYKADVAASKGTVESLAAALKYLEQAAALNLEDRQAGMIKEKRKSVRNLKKAAEDKRKKESANPAKTQ